MFKQHDTNVLYVFSEINVWRIKIDFCIVCILSVKAKQECPFNFYRSYNAHPKI